MLKNLLLGLVAILVGFLGYVAMQPDHYEVVRTKVVPASPDTVYAIVSDFGRFPEWNPWRDADPNMKTELKGEAGKVGTVYSWKGNDEAGAGSMTITEVEPSKRVGIALKFEEPFPSEATTGWVLAPEKDGTEVSWTMSGENNFVGKLFCVFMDMDAMIGKDFEKGLAKLHEVAAAEQAKVDAAAAEPAAEAPETETEGTEEG